jgi:hypothetical protein
MSFSFGKRRGTVTDITELPEAGRSPLSTDELAHFEFLDLAYRSMCALLFNYVPMSGHPGGSISSGRFVAADVDTCPRHRLRLRVPVRSAGLGSVRPRLTDQ